MANMPYIYCSQRSSNCNPKLLVAFNLLDMKKEEKNTKVRFHPAGDRVLVKPEITEDEKSPSGIIIPDTARKEKPETGIIVAVGPGKRSDRGDLIPIRFEVGDKIMFSKYGYDEVTIKDEEYYVIMESNILGTF